MTLTVVVKTMLRTNQSTNEASTLPISMLCEMDTCQFYCRVRTQKGAKLSQGCMSFNDNGINILDADGNMFDVRFGEPIRVQ